MKLNLLTAIAIGSLAASVIPAAAAAGLSPAGGKSEATYDASSNNMFVGQSQNLVIPSDVTPTDAWNRIRGSLSPNGSDR